MSHNSIGERVSIPTAPLSESNPEDQPALHEVKSISDLLEKSSESKEKDKEGAF